MRRVTTARDNAIGSTPARPASTTVASRADATEATPARSRVAPR
jgi:hypothetical protein